MTKGAGISDERPESESNSSLPVIQIVRQYSLYFGDFRPAVTIPPLDNEEQGLRIAILDGNQNHSSRNRSSDLLKCTQMPIE